MSIAVGETAGDTVAPAWTLRRVVSAGVIGNVLEWYDFAVYGFFTPILATQFFPSEDRVVSLLAAFATFAVGFLMRPVGAALFGHIGDRYGRARALLISVAMMAIPTVLMGFLPTYATIGVAASFLIVLLRMFQGMAVGGEFTSSIVFLAEHAPQKRRGFIASFAMFGATSGTMLGSAVGGLLTTLLSPEDLAAWGWRAAFISGIAVAIVAIILRRNLLDERGSRPSVSPLRLAFRHHRYEVLRTFALNMGTATTYYTLFVFAATWVAERTPLPRSLALDITTLSIVTFLVVLPCAAWASDLFGRKLVMVVGMTGCILLAYPLVSLMHGTSPIAIGAAQMTFSALLALSMAPQPAAMCEMFPHEVRVSAVSVGYGLAYALFGGTAPVVAVWLIARTGNDVGFAWYVAAVMVVSLAIAVTTRDRRTAPLN
jgi:MHS family proline/betaine transporter-like MFS transporter